MKYLNRILYSTLVSLEDTNRESKWFMHEDTDIPNHLTVLRATDPYSVVNSILYNPPYTIGTNLDALLYPADPWPIVPSERFLNIGYTLVGIGFILTQNANEWDGSLTYTMKFGTVSMWDDCLTQTTRIKWNGNQMIQSHTVFHFMKTKRWIYSPAAATCDVSDSSDVVFKPTPVGLFTRASGGDEGYIDRMQFTIDDVSTPTAIAALRIIPVSVRNIITPKLARMSELAQPCDINVDTFQTY